MSEVINVSSEQEEVQETDLQFVESPETDVERPAINRLTVVEQVYHEVSGSDPVCRESRFQRILSSEEQPWQRTKKIGPVYEKVDFGWIEEASSVAIRCDGPYPIAVAFSISNGAWEVVPGESLRGTPDQLEKLVIKSLGGPTKYTVFAVPR